jgi:CheY-like chemotaxis protein
MLILYIEDDPTDADLVARYLRNSPHQLKVAKSVEEAAEILSEDPALVLVDIMLNRSRQGFNFVSQLREQGYTQPVIAVTALSLPTEKAQCIEAGCTEVLTKPYMIDQLAGVMNKYLL